MLQLLYSSILLLKSGFKYQILNITKISVQQKTIMTTHIRSNMITYLVPSYKENKKCQSSISRHNKFLVKFYTQMIFLTGWQLVYDNSPKQLYRAFNDSVSALEANILGGEACMWSEQVAGEAIEAKLWPRGAALGERLWSDLSTGGFSSFFRNKRFILYEMPVQHRGYP